MDIEAFLKLPREEVARLVRQDGPKVCVFALNGTRRWFKLEHPPPKEDFARAYIEAISQRIIELARLFFENGIDTLLMPALSPHLMARGDSYVDTVAFALSQLTDDPRYLDFYDTFDVRVRFYGDHRRCLAPTPYAHLSDSFDQLTRQTLSHNRHRLLWGVCAHDAAETLIALSIQYYNEHGHAPDTPALIELYYGESMPPAGLFISSGKPRVFDIPLVTNGREDIYYTVAPAPYLNESQLRSILYDHLYARRKTGATYEWMQDKDWTALRDFYHMNLDNTLGVGARKQAQGLWHPLPQVTLPDGFVNLPDDKAKEN